MDVSLFKSILKPQFESMTLKDADEVASALSNAYDTANKSAAFTQFGSKFISGNKGILKKNLKNGLELNSKLKERSKDTEPGWIMVASGFMNYWLNASFTPTPPAPPAISPTTGTMVVSFGDIKNLAKKLKAALTLGDLEDGLTLLSDVLVQHQSTLTGTYAGLTPAGAATVPISVPWVGILGKAEPKVKKTYIIETIETTKFVPLKSGKSFFIKYVEGPFGTYAVRTNTAGKTLPVIPHPDLSNARQINGRLALSLIVAIKGEPGLLEKNCAYAFLKMREDAKKDGLNIHLNTALSGYRPLGRPGDMKFRRNGSEKHKTQWAAREDYNDCLQKKEKNCEKRFAANVHETYGESNHGWGRAIDIGYIKQKTEEQEWIRMNGWQYGFYWGEQMDEEWHFTWVLPGYVPDNAGLGTYYVRNESGKIDPSNEQ
jgi:hypothetical protein